MSLVNTIPDFSAASILVIGDVMLDRYWFGDAARISPEAPVPIVKVTSMDHRPGGAGNVALNIAALGAKVTLLGLIGNDEAAQQLELQLNAAGVNHDLCKLDTLSTIIKLRLISRHQQLLRMDFEETLSAAHNDLLLEHYKKQLPNANLVILSDYHKGTLVNPAQLIKLAREAGIPVLVDPKSTDYSCYREANIITPNFKEFEAVVGKCATDDEMLVKGRALLAAHHMDALLITRGEHGMMLIQQDKVVHLSAYAREVFDVTGAGDTVIGVLGASVAAGVDITNAMALANLAASISVGKLGAATVSVAELQVAVTGKTNFASGILSETELLSAVKEARMQGKKIVFTNGCFDVLHAGHVTYLQLAKQLGDYLIVAVNEDDSIRKAKGQHRPVNTLDDRMTVLAALQAIDWIISFPDDTPERLLKLIQPDLLVKGSDYQAQQIVGADIVRSYGGEARIINHNKVISSTDILQKLQLQESVTYE